MDLESIFGWIEQSRYTVIGYDSRGEMIKDELVSKLPSLRLEVTDSSFSLRDELIREIRDRKASCVLEGAEYDIPKFVIVDMSLFSMNMDNYVRMSRFSERMWADATEHGICVVVLRQTNKILPDTEPHDVSIRPSQLLYSADFAISITSDSRSDKATISVLKNRYGHDQKKTEITLGQAKDFNYISVHETS